MVYRDHECVGGECVSTETDWRTDLVGCEDCDLLDYYDDWEFYCVDGETWKHHTFHDFSCSGGECVEIASNYTDEQFIMDCDTFDYYDDWEYYCVDGSVWRTRDLHDFYCLGGTCYEDVMPETEWVEDCDLLDYYDDWEFYCIDGEVWMHRMFHDYSCVDGACTEVDSYYTDEQFVEDCDDGNPSTIDTCENGVCVHIAAYNLTMAADPEEGGTATDLTNKSPYEEGAGISIEAEAAEGYEFVNWTAPAGAFDDASAAETIFTMPAQNVTVTANFEAVQPPPVYPAVTTQAATGITANSAILNMSYTVGDYTSVQVRFAYKKSIGSDWSYTAWVSESADGTHAASLTELPSNTQYQFNAQLKYDDTVIEGTTLQFTTDKPSTPPPSGGGCFIATAAYGTPTAEQINVLRDFRDVVLLNSTVGCQFVALYYKLSPPVADFIAKNELLRTLVREFLIDPIVWVVEATGDMWRN
jgi:uncharacterized repeat protein (TIGR02543 family)